MGGVLIFTGAQRYLRIRYSSRVLVICAFAKAGTTSLFSFLYISVVGRPYVLHKHNTCGVHGNKSRCAWEQVYTQDVASWPNHRSSATYQALFHAKNASTRVFYIVRDPLDRYVSAYRSKVTCGTHEGIDKLDRDKIVPGLVRLSQTGGREGYGNKKCLSWLEFVTCLLAVHKTNRTASLDAHFSPQGHLKQCGNGGTRLTVQEFGNTVAPRLSQRYHLYPANFSMEDTISNETNETIFHGRHATSNETIMMSPVDSRALCSIVRAEYAWLGQLDEYAKRCR